jgi:hypothetical protein
VPRSIQHRDDLSTRLSEIAGWQTARRDDAKVAIEAHRTREIDRVSALNEAAFFDELFQYIREIGAWSLLEQLDPAERKGAFYPFILSVLFTIMRCVGGVQSMLATHELLLTDEALMGVLGFNVAQVQHGSTERGASRRTEPVEIRGPFSHETVADNIVKLSVVTKNPSAGKLCGFAHVAMCRPPTSGSSTTRPFSGPCTGLDVAASPPPGNACTTCCAVHSALGRTSHWIELPTTSGRMV